MKRKIYLILIIGVTFLTTKTIIDLHPLRSSSLDMESYSQLSNFITGAIGQDVREDETVHTIDDETLSEFIKIYSNKSIETLEIYEKEEIRCILENMGRYNTEKLDEFLKDDLEKREEKIYKLLNENLFDEQLMILDEILK